MQRDFNSMQADAIKAAREMKSRAKPAQGNAVSQVKKPPPSKTVNVSEGNIKIKKQPQRSYNSGGINFPPPKEIFGHRNPWTPERETPFCSDACPVKSILGIAKKGSASSQDNEVMMLMALMLLLATDGGDKVLMLAILYIMM